MILFFGTRPGKKEIKTLPNVACPNCSQTGHLTITTRPNYIHIFWIPIFRLKTHRLAECTYCKRGFYQEEFSDEMIRAL